MNPLNASNPWDRHAFARCGVAAALAASAVVAVPWAASAAENRPPSQPALSELTTEDKPCVGGTERPYVRTRPTLGAVLRDPDGGSVSAEFEVSWTDGSGVRQVRSTVQTTAKYTGSPFSWTVPTDVPAFTGVSWRVRASDGTLWGPWSSDGGSGPCEFVYDTEAPAKPSVSSPEYPDDTGQWHDGVGVYGTFTVDSTSDDTVSYRYGFLGEPQRTAVPDEPGGPVELRWLPQSEGVKGLDVQAVDRAGNASAPATYRFRVSGGRTPVAAWTLADAAGADEASAEAGGRTATAGDGVEFGAAGPSRTSVTGAVALDGSDSAYLTSGAPAVDTGGAFAVSAWVRPDAVGTDMRAVSQTGGGTAGFGLGTADGAWSFSVGGSVVRGGVPEAGDWAHLTGVYDPVAGTARLYVNGRAAGTAENVTGADASGNLQIGRTLAGENASASASGSGNWRGALAGVRVWDRIVVAAEAAGAAKRATVSEGYWPLDEAVGGGSPERDGGRPLTLGGDAAIYRDDAPCDWLDPDCLPAQSPLFGAGHLLLDGDGDFAATDGRGIATGDSFSVAAHVRIDAAAQDRPMTVLSVRGADNSLAEVRYSGASQNWEVALTDADGEPVTLTAGGAWASPDDVHHLALVYDDESDEILLHADGQLSARQSYRPGWTTTGDLQIGRSQGADGWGGYLAGAVDEVHVYAGVLGATQVAQLASGATDV
ncbi:LamG domain-containing protein [Streptomyces sp. NBC_01451]|uniref:LamG domain-containing protein n=1 Tax=Streptomyces sp. NBC_01451 TaxID=2903872 RepID=UPI002E36AD5C|nr:LamG domain-containing protein [Streptomyces sp. NBC_01451]